MKSTTQKIIGAAVIAIGLLFTYVTGNAKSFMIYVGLAVGVTIIIAGAMIFMTSEKGPSDPKTLKRNKLLKKILGIASIAIAALMFILGAKSESEGSIVFGTLILILGTTLLSSGSTGTAEDMPFKIIDTMKEDVPTIFNRIMNIETPLGFAWITTMSSIPGQKVLVFGPDANDFYIYCFYFGGEFRICCNTVLLFVDHEEVDHRLDIDLRALSSAPEGDEFYLSLLDAYYNAFSEYSRTGSFTVTTTPPVS